MTTSASSIAGQIIPIAGAGISLGLLAHMSRGVMDTMYKPYNKRRYKYKPKKRTYYRPPRYEWRF